MSRSRRVRPSHSHAAKTANSGDQLDRSVGEVSGGAARRARSKVEVDKPPDRLDPTPPVPTTKRRRNWGKLSAQWVGLTAAVAATLGALVFSGANARATDKQLELARQGQITDRYAAAIGQLGSDSIEVRYGAVYSLKRVMADSPDDQPTVINVLSAFVRNSLATRTAVDGPLVRPPTDVLAAIEVLDERHRQHDGGQHVDFSEINFSRFDLRQVHMNTADLAGARLIGADLNGAYLNGANLTNADLTNADLTGVHLIGATLTGARLPGANLTDATLTDATWAGADLTNATLTGLTGEDFIGADLTGARYCVASRSAFRVSRKPQILKIAYSVGCH